MLRFLRCPSLWILLVALAPASRADGPDLERKVSVTVVAAPLKEALRQLSQAAGYPLVPLKALEHEVVSLRMKDAPLREAMDRIAQAMRAEWRAEQGQHRLTVGSDLARRQATEEAQAAVAEVRAALASARGEGGSGNADASAVIRAFDPALLAAIQPNARVAFATSPNRSQVAMPRAVAQALDRLIAEARRARAASPAENQGPPWMAPPDSPAVKGIVVFSSIPHADGSFLGFEIAAFDAEGRVVVQRPDNVPIKTRLGATAARLPEARGFRMPPDAARLAEMLGEPVATETAVTGRSGQTVLRVGDGFLTLGEVSGTPHVSRAKPPTKLSDEWIQRLTNPDTVEPHSLAAGAVLQAVAEAADRNLAAWLTDRAFSRFGAVAKAKGPDDVLRTAAEEWGLTSSVEGGWLVVGPSRPLLARARTIDRKVLGAALRLLRSQSVLNLDQQAAYVRSQPNGGFPDGLDRAYESLLGVTLPGHREFESIRPVRSLLLFYASLGQANLRALAAGRAIPLSAIGPAARNIVSSMVLNSVQGLVPVGMPPMGPPPAFAWNEATELLPNGVPPDTPVELTIRQEPIAFGLDPDTGFRVPLSRFELAILRNPQMVEGGRVRRFERFLLGTQSVLQFRFRVAPNALFAGSLADQRPLPMGREMTLDQLPPELFQMPPQITVEVPTGGPVQGTEQSQ
ncbi:MAG: hypothetical protein ACK41F_05370 [Fimbriimonadaceae bacterium]